MITYNYATVRNQKIFYREAGNPAAPTIVLLHGFPTSSHMFRDLIPQLEDNFHIIAPDFPGFGYSDAPSASTFTYTFDNLAAHIEELLFTNLGLTKFAIYVQDYGAPVGYRIAAAHPEAITGIIVQNGNAYAEGIGDGFAPLKVLWANRTPENEAATRTAMLSFETTRFQYTHGTKNPSAISPDSYTFDQYFLDRPGNAEVQIDLAYDYQNNFQHYPTWQAFFRKYQPPTLIVWGQNDPFFTVEGAKAYLRDLPKAEFNLIDTGHFALEEESHFIARKIRTFFAA
jgi:pimeloyl-ACP methyl ester carboxylesterase